MRSEDTTTQPDRCARAESRRGSPARCRYALLITTLLAALPATALAGWWCSWAPWWFGCGAAGECGGGMTKVAEFGTNQGNLTMCRHVPRDLERGRPLVVVLHGCLQKASDYDDETGWVKFADRHRFALLLPQQRRSNNWSTCFNWFALGDNQRGHGEAASIRQMIERMRDDFDIDPQRVYVTGLSAGGSMTAVMLATYPELFAGGAIVAGTPYGCASNLVEALSECGLSLSRRLGRVKDLSPDAWGDLVRGASGHEGPYPPVSIWQGGADTTVNPREQAELVDQWTNVHGIDQIPDDEDTINGRVHKVYENAAGKALVEAVLIPGMGHGVPVDPGGGDDQCGASAPFVLDVGVCSSFHIMKFWALDSQ